MARRAFTPRSKQVRIEGLADLQFRLNELGLRLNSDEVKRINMERGAIPLRDRIRANAPVSSEPHKIGTVTIQPGTLRRAVFAAYGNPGKQDVLVGVNIRIAPHAHWVEYGTVKMQAKPYMRPAITQMRATVVSGIAEGYRELIAEYS